MSNNPNKPPESDPSGARTPDVPGSPLRGILTGLAIDLGGSAVLGIVLTNVYALTLSGQDMTDAQIDDALQHIPAASAFGVLSIVLGALMSVLGGFVCARVVLRNEYRVGAAMVVVSVLLGLALGGDGDLDDLGLLLVLCTAACNMLGVKYGAEYNRRLEALATPPATPPADTPTP